MNFFLIKGDITKVKTDAIVNAANNSLLGGGGVDGAIHRAAGSALLEECRTLNGCETGQAKITKAYNIPINFIIHTVGPIWRDGSNHEEELLSSCYKECMKLASAHKISSIAFPNISTGIYGFPKEKAAKIAIETLKTIPFPAPTDVLFVCFDEENYHIYEKFLI